MSQRALALAVRNYLRTQVPLKDEECEIMFDGQPPPMAGQRFASVWHAEWQAEDVEAIDEYFGLNVTVSVRTAYAPMDRGVFPLLADQQGLDLDHLVRKIMTAIHLDAPGNPAGDAILNAANVIINAEPTGAANGFIEPLRFRGGSAIEPKGSEWFGAEPDSGVVGIAQTIHFGGARRVQNIESMT